MSKLGDLVLSVFFPRRCVGCGKVGTNYCPRCIKKIELLPQFCIACKRPSFDGSTHFGCKRPLMLDGVFAFSHYKDSMKRAIRLLKYHSVSDLTETLGGLLLANCPKYIKNLDLFIPVPLHSKRERLRGYNQSKLLAISLGKKLSIPVLPDV